MSEGGRKGGREGGKKQGKSSLGDHHQQGLEIL